MDPFWPVGHKLCSLGYVASEEIVKHQSHKFTRKLTFKAVGLSGVRAGTRPNRLCARNGCSFGDRVEDAKELLKYALMELKTHTKGRNS
jgi:hypothetical protein